MPCHDDRAPLVPANSPYIFMKCTRTTLLFMTKEIKLQYAFLSGSLNVIHAFSLNISMKYNISMTDVYRYIFLRWGKFSSEVSF
jgi:hypothetical protein